MTLRFYARHDHRVYYPGLKTANGQPPMYLGRDFVRAVDSKPPTPSMSPATESAIECESGSEVANRVMRLMTVDKIDAPFFCADEATAAETGLPYVPCVFKDGVWVESSPSTDTE